MGRHAGATVVSMPLKFLVAHAAELA